MIIFTNGCFDQIHVGHIRLLKFCYSIGLLGKESGSFRGWKLVIGLNSDKSIRRLKGDKRPFYKAEYRKEVLESICYIDQDIDKVIIFEEDTPIELIRKIKPDIIVKGGDYKPEDVVGNEFAEVRIFPLLEV